MFGIQNSAKHAAAMATQNIAAAQGSGPHNRNQAAHEELIYHCKVSF